MLRRLLAVLLAALNDGFHLLAGIRHGHFVEQEPQADVRPVVVGRIINAVADGDDAHARVPQILQFNQPAGISAAEA